MKDYTPRGPEWLSRALRMPKDAIPWYQSGSLLALANGAEGTLWTYTVLPAVNGLRIAGFIYGVSAAASGYSWRFFRNGNRYDQSVGNFLMPGSPTPVVVPLFLVYQPTELAELRVNNATGAGRDIGSYAWGWLF